MSTEFEKLEALLTYLSPVNGSRRWIAMRRPNSPPDGGGWPIVLASGVLSFPVCDGRTGALLKPGSAWPVDPTIREGIGSSLRLRPGRLN